METLNNRRDIQYFGKFRAYLFANFAVISLGLLFAVFMFFLKGEPEVGVLLLIFLAGSALIDVLLWKSVEKKVPQDQRREVFVAFGVNGILISAKILLSLLVITIPLVLHIGGEFEYKEYTIIDGLNRGQTVFAKNCGNGEVEDTNGKRYKVS